MFAHLEPYAGDPILGLNQAFGRDPRPNKINLSIGIYFDDEGRIPVMQAVREAHAQTGLAWGARPYLPMEGDAVYREEVQRLLLGDASPARRDQRAVTIQTLGGSGALKVGADFLRRAFPKATLALSDPSWDNHRSIFEGAGFEVSSYPYLDAQSGTLRFEAMCEAINALPAGTLVLLHACCHNPSGVDPSPEQWRVLIELMQARGLLPFLDLAYQGFGDGLEADAHALRALDAAGLPFVVAQSFSKSFSLYGERCGALTLVCPSAEQARTVLGQLQATVRRNYSSPPTTGARLVSTVLGTPTLRQMWEAELTTMRERMKRMRRTLQTELERALPGQDMSRHTRHAGMFTHTSLSPQQIDVLREQHGVYLVRNGRMCVAGLFDGNVTATAQALAQVMR